jgi:hypothetical protein
MSGVNDIRIRRLQAPNSSQYLVERFILGFQQGCRLTQIWLPLTLLRDIFCY